MNNNDKFYKLANLANSTQRLMMQIKDLSEQFIQLNFEFREVISLLEEREDILIALSSSGKQVIARFDLSGNKKRSYGSYIISNSPTITWILGIVDIPEDAEAQIVIEPIEILDTWKKVDDYYPKEISDKAKHLAER